MPGIPNENELDIAKLIANGSQRPDREINRTPRLERPDLQQKRSKQAETLPYGICCRAVLREKRFRIDAVLDHDDPLARHAAQQMDR